MGGAWPDEYTWSKLCQSKEYIDKTNRVNGNNTALAWEEALHIPPRALPGQEVVTIKTEGCVLTLGPQRCYKYDFLNNWPSPLGDLATLTAFFGNPEK